MQVGAAVMVAAVTVGAANYAGLAGVCALEALVPPMAGPALPLAGLAVASGDAGLGWSVVAATLGATTGGLVVFLVSRQVGEEVVREVVLRRARRPEQRARRFEAADRWFRRHSEVAVVVGRCVPIVRSLVTVPAAWTEMSLPRFAILTMLGNALWSAAVIGVASIVGHRWGAAPGWVRPLQLVLAAMWVAALTVLALRSWRRRTPEVARGEP